MIAITALATGLLAALLGSRLLTIWLQRAGNAPGRSHIRQPVIFGHLAIGLAGLALWIAYLVGGTPAWLAWTVCAVIAVASSVGAVMFIPWWRRRRKAATTAGGAAAALPAERHFPLPVVVVHGMLADVTLVLVLLTALGVRG
jgi:Na+/proline symporter